MPLNIQSYEPLQKMIHQIITHFTDDDLYKFSMCCAVIDNFPRAQVQYKFVDRDNTLYPQGFADELKRQIALLENVVITDEEINFMKCRCSYLPHWFYTFLKGYRYHREWVTVEQDNEGHLYVDFEGSWSDTILLEVKVLAIISELYYIMKALKDCYKNERELTGRLVGTSNVYLAMKHDLQPVGTMAHEFVCAIGGMYGPQMANHIAMDCWRNTFRGALGTYLYDSFGWNIFALNFSEDFANLFKGLRVDSGDNYEQLQKIVSKYRSLGIDPCTKQVVFSNALDTNHAIEIQQYACKLCQP